MPDWELSARLLTGKGNLLIGGFQFKSETREFFVETCVYHGGGGKLPSLALLLSRQSRQTRAVLPQMLAPTQKLFAPPRTCVRANSAFVFASSCRVNFTASSPVFERVIGSLFFSARVRRGQDLKVERWLIFTAKMPRQLRVEYEGAVYHVMARGDRREAIYHDDRDRFAWVGYLDQVCRRTEWRVYGWVLMGNHYHLLVETPRANLVSGMQWLQTAYTVWFNRRHNLSGHLFGGRYKAVLIDDGEPSGNMLYGYLGTVLDYLHLNPVRAGIVGGRSGKSLLDYRWSSLTGAYLCSPRKRPQWARVEMAFSLFDLKDSAAGRRQFLERLELRVREEAARSCGARLPEAQSLQSTLRRGWSFGSQAFRVGTRGQCGI